MKPIHNVFHLKMLLQPTSDAINYDDLNCATIADADDMKHVSGGI